MLYKIRNLKKSYNGKTILDIDSFDIQPGTSYALTGANGAGKTTFLQILALLEHPDRGSLEFAEEPVIFNESQLIRLRRRITMVDQHPLLFNISVRENVALPLQYRKVGRAEAIERADAILRQVDMLSFADKSGANLSGGEVQRVALARAMICDPELLLLDEPFANIDQQHVEAIETMILACSRERKRSMVLATHNQAQAKALAERHLHIEGARLLQF